MANRYFKSGATLWNNANSWSVSASTGTDNAGIPTYSDDIIFNSGSGNCTISTTATSGLTLTFATYTGTVTANVTINVSGNTTLGSSMTIAGTGDLVIRRTATLTSNGKTWPNNLTISGTSTITLADNWNIGGSFTNSAAITINGNNLSVGTNATFNANTSGTTTFVMVGTGVISTVGLATNLRNNLTINTSGTTTFSGTVNLHNMTLKYISGTTVTAGSSIFCAQGGSTTTFDCSGSTVGGSITTTNTNGINFNSIDMRNSGTFVINSPLTVVGGVFISGTITGTSQSIYLSSSAIFSGSTVITGIPKIIINGSNVTFGTPITFSQTVLSATPNLIFDLSGGTVTLGAVLGLTLTHVQYSSGTIVTSANTLNCNNSVRLDTSGMTWNAVNIQTTNNLTINIGNNFSCSGNVIQSVITTISGTGTSFTTTGNYTNSAGALTITLNLTLNVSGNITTNGAFFCNGTSNFDGSFTYTNSVSGNGTIVMRGSGTISGATAVLFFAPNLIFSGTGTITFSGIMYKSGGTITTISGVNVNTIGSTLVPTNSAMPIFNTQHMTWNNITFSGVTTQQIQMLSTLNISGTTLLSNGSGSGNNISFSGIGTFNPTGTLTLAAAHIIQFPNTLNLNILNLTANNSLTNSVIINTQSFSGTSNLSTNAISNPTLVFTGTGVWNSSGLIAINTIINSVATTLLGTSTFAPPTTTKTLTYSGGTVITSGNTFIVSGIPTLNTNGSSSGGATTTSSTGINFNNFNIVASTTLTLTSDLCAVSSFSGSGTVTSVANTVYIGGNLTLTGNITGTAPFVMNGTGTWSGNFSLQKNLSFNSIGTVTLNGLLQYGPGTLTYTAGIINVGTSTVSIISNTTIAGSMMFYNLNIGGSPTITLNTSTPTINNTLLLSGSTNFTSTGVIGFTTTNFSSVTTSLTHTLKTGTTYTVNSSLVLIGTSAGAVTLKSSNTSGSTFFNLIYGATQRVAFVTATDINSSGGQTIWDYKGTLTRTTNWNLLTTPITLAETFVY